jgi:uncharacterized protein (TIGR02145 family)
MTDNATIEKYCYDNNPANCTTYGGLYQWDEAMQYSTTEGAQGISPNGFHIPKEVELYTLENYLATGTCDPIRDTSYDCSPAATKLLSGGSSGFNALYSGARNTDGTYGTKGSQAHYWTSLQSGSNVWMRSLVSGHTGTLRRALTKLQGFSVRPIANTLRQTTAKHAGTGAAKVVAPSASAIPFYQELNVGDTNDYTISAYAYTDGSAVTSADVQLYYNGSAVSTAYGFAGGGWYTLAATVTGANAVRSYGVEVKASKTVYIDDFAVTAGSGAATTLHVLNSGTGIGSLAVEGDVTAASFKTSTALNTAADGGSTPAFTANMAGSTGGPTTAAQNGWVKMKDSTGADIWVPVWK